MSKQKEPILIRFIKEVEKDAGDARNWPVLLVHKDFQLPMIGICSRMKMTLTKWSGALPKAPIVRFTHPAIQNQYSFLPLESFFAWASPQFFITYKE